MRSISSAHVLNSLLVIRRLIMYGIKKFTTLQFLALALLLQNASKAEVQIPQPEAQINKCDDCNGMCRGNLKELAFVIYYYRRTHSGNYPDSLGDMYFFENSLLDKQSAKKYKTDHFFCPLFAKGEFKEYIYHKPPPNAPDDFIVLECPNHHIFPLWTVKNIGKDENNYNFDLYPPQPGTYRAIACNENLDQGLREASIRWLGHTLSREYICAFLPYLLNDKNKEIRKTVIDEIANYRCQEAIQALENAFLREKDEEIKSAIGDALIKLTVHSDT